MSDDTTVSEEQEHELSATDKKMRDAVLEFLSIGPDAKRIFDEFAASALSGDRIDVKMARLVTFEWFFAVGALISGDEEDLNRTLERLGLGESQRQELRALWARTHSLLRAPFDAATDAYLYGVTNTWTTLDAHPVFRPIRKMIMLDVSLRNGLTRVYESQDKLEDFLALSRALLAHSRDALQWVSAEGISLDKPQMDAIRRRIGELSRVVKELSEAMGIEDADKQESAG